MALRPFFLILFSMLCGACFPAFADGEPSVDEYLAMAGKEARKIPAGEMRFGTMKVYCGKRPTVIDPKLDSWGGSFPGYIILNPVHLNKEPLAVKLYVYAHECGHQFRGISETVADEFAIRRGVRYGWLDASGMDQVCEFISKVRADSAHPAGHKRCRHMRGVFDSMQASKR
jgi:hypothetical protein